MLRRHTAISKRCMNLTCIEPFFDCVLLLVVPLHYSDMCRFLSLSTAPSRALHRPGSVCIFPLIFSNLCLNCADVFNYAQVCGWSYRVITKKPFSSIFWQSEFVIIFWNKTLSWLVLLSELAPKITGTRNHQKYGWWIEGWDLARRYLLNLSSDVGGLSSRFCRIK